MLIRQFFAQKSVSSPWKSSRLRRNRAGKSSSTCCGRPRRWTRPLSASPVVPAAAVPLASPPPRWPPCEERGTDRASDPHHLRGQQRGRSERQPPAPDGLRHPEHHVPAGGTSTQSCPCTRTSSTPATWPPISRSTMAALASLAPVIPSIIRKRPACWRTCRT